MCNHFGIRDESASHNIALYIVTCRPTENTGCNQLGIREVSASHNIALYIVTCRHTENTGCKPTRFSGGVSITQHSTVHNHLQAYGNTVCNQLSIREVSASHNIALYIVTCRHTENTGCKPTRFSGGVSITQHSATYMYIVSCRHT